ncbi:peptidyl-prolyl cis-trans isomerase [Aureococcus anophagefferens]|nr:peptidyl-prolyl cis-trans isomerase [Aureococcus anophagefferens]
MLARLALAMLASASAMKPSSRRHFVSGVAASAAALPRLASAADGFTKTESGLQFKDLKEGDGAVPAPGQTVKVHYTGWLNDFDDLDGKFDSSYDRGKPLTFAVGGTRRVVIPSEIGYGAKGAGGIIPGGATLYFEMKLLGLQ